MVKKGVQGEEAVQKFAEQLKTKESLLIDKDDKLETIARATGMNIHDTKSLKEELSRIASAPGSVRKRNF